MKGYEVRTTQNPEWKAYFFYLFEDKDTAEAFVRTKEKEKGLLIKVVECELEWCPNCQDRLMHESDHECSFCDHLRCDL